MDEFLAFVDFIGKTHDDFFLYEFDFTEDTDSVWGEFFNVSPSILVPNIEIDRNCLSSSITVKIDNEMFLSKRNSCFSMQDAIDGILPLCFPSLKLDYKEINYKPVFFMFGEEKDEVLNKISICEWEIESESVIEKPESELDKMINEDDDE